MLAVRVAAEDDSPFVPERPAPVELVRAAKRGDRRAWGVLFHTYQPAVTAYCLVCAKGRRDEALDLTQEIFAKAIAKVAGLEDEGRFQGWLFTIARHHCLRAGRGGGRELALSALLTDGTAPDPSEPAEREAWLQAVQGAIGAVENDKHRDIIAAHYGAGEKTRAIAARLGVPHGTVTVVLMRFRERLKRELLGELAGGGR